jgi:acyl carrier protein
MAYLQDNLVRGALGLYVGTNPSDIDAGDELSRDLGLEPLDLVLVMFRLEELADAEFAMSDLEGVVTVGDLEALVSEWLRASAKGNEDDPVEPGPDPGRSGTHAIDPSKLRAAR